jgi:hypothetical protein
MMPVMVVLVVMWRQLMEFSPTHWKAKENL